MRSRVLARVCLILFAITSSAHAAGGSKTRSLALWGNPGALFFGQLLGGADFRVSPKATFGPTFGGLSKTGNDVTLAGPAFGFRVNIMPKGAIGQGLRFSGLLVGSMMSAKSGNYEYSTTNVMLQGLVGYHFLFGSVTVGIGAGPAFYTLPSTVEMETKSGTKKEFKMPAFALFGPAVEFSLGVAL